MYNNNYNNNSPDDDSAGEIFSWIIVIICMFAFMPLGIIMLFRKLAKTAKSTRKEKVFSAPPPRASDKQAKKGREASVPKKSGRLLSVVLLLVSIILIFLGVRGAYDAGRDITYFGLDSGNSWNLITSLLFLAGGGATFFARNLGKGRTRRYMQYLTMMRGRDIMSVEEAARSVGVSEGKAKRDLLAMIDEGYFGRDAFLDAELSSVVMNPEVAKRVRASAEKPPEKREEETAQAPPKTENQYMAIIYELRSLNDTIADISISDKIDRIEMLTAKIFRTVEENPAKLPQIRKFMNYYLPTTLKLLRDYATLERQGIKGDNITNAKKNIGRILDTLSQGYEQQLDKLFESDVIDITADINVLENMMEQDGLTSGGAMFKAAGGTDVKTEETP